MKKCVIGISAILILIAVQLTSCDKEPKNQPHDPDPVDTLPVEVLNANSGYTQFYDDVIPLSEVSGSFNSASVGVCDYTIDADGNFNLVYYGEQPTQQDAFKSYFRVSKNVQSNAMVSLPSGADNLNTGTQIVGNKTYQFMQFRPYTNFFTYATQTNSTGFGSNNTALFEGDIYCAVSSPDPIGLIDMCFKYPCLNLGGMAGNNVFGYFTSGVPNPTYLLSSCNPYRITFLNNSGQPIGLSFLESKQAGTNSSIAVSVRPDSVIAYSIDNNYERSGIVSSIQLSGFTGVDLYNTARHYTTDGSMMSLLIQSKTNGQVWTMSYNFNTQQLTKGLDGVTLEYSGTGSDVDIDELGNVYYTGWAANGSNTTGVSIYKKEVNGTVGLVGQDNILKYGTVAKLKVLNGKVYAAVIGKKTGASLYQVSIIKQN